MNPLELDLRYLGVWDKAVQIMQDLGSQAALGYIRSSYRLLSKVYHPDLQREERPAAEEGMRRLNAVKARLDSVPSSELTRLLASACGPNGGHPRVMVVEDEETLGENLANLLALEGYHVARALNGIEGLRLHLTFRPELVISDVVMPLMDGVEMVRHLRRRDPNLRALFISGFFGASSIRHRLVREIEDQGHALICKPFKPSHLLSLVRQSLT